MQRYKSMQLIARVALANDGFLLALHPTSTNKEGSANLYIQDFLCFSVDIGQGIFRKNFLSLLKSGRRWEEVDLRLGVNNFHQTEQIKSLNL